MPAASILIKPSSANCNIDCKYCFYKCLSSNREEYSKGFMSEETLEQLIIQAIDYADNYVAFAFQGGEPTLAGVDFFHKVVDLQNKHNNKGLTIENTIQTNGILIDEEWAQFLSENHFLVGLSLDGPKKVHDKYRVDALGNPTFEKVMHTVGLFNQYHVEYNILSVITNESVKKASGLYNFYKRNGFAYIQLIPCMDEMTRDTSNTAYPNQPDLSAAEEPDTQVVHNQYAVNPTDYGRFLCELFDLWYEDFMQGQNMDIRMFSNLAQMAAGYPAEECGMNGSCNCYFVVEGDGSVYPCDFYCMDEWKLGTVQDSFQKLIVSDKVKEFLTASHAVHEKCKTCPHFQLCRGGCRRWRETGNAGELDLNYLCPAYEIFFEHCGERIGELGKMILNRFGTYQG